MSERSEPQRRVAAIETNKEYVVQNREGQAGRRIVVNGKLLTYKQTALFEKLIRESDTFQKRFMELSESK